MTQLPSNVSSTADVKVNDSDYGAIAEVERNDKITIRNTLKVTGNFLEDKKLETSIDLAQELNIPERILINGNQVDTKDILITGNRVTLNLGDYFVLGDTLIIELETDLREAIPEKVLTMHFEYLEDAKLIEQSNDINLTILRDMFLTLIQRIQKVSFPKIQRISIFITEKESFIFQRLLSMLILGNTKYPINH